MTVQFSGVYTVKVKLSGVYRVKVHLHRAGKKEEFRYNIIYSYNNIYR